jgi:mRNA-degrading endonuclease HigB of HigAB toxin-antitoxin module
MTEEWSIEQIPGWDRYFRKFDKEIQLQILKKISQLIATSSHRRLHQSKFCVEEVGQYRICFIIEEETRKKYIHFVGNHKQYEKWYKSSD